MPGADQQSRRCTHTRHNPQNSLPPGPLTVQNSDMTKDERDSEREARSRYPSAIFDDAVENEVRPQERVDEPVEYRSNVFEAGPIANYIKNAAKNVSRRPLFGPFWREGELAILFSDTGQGKSILATQIGESIASGKQVPGFEKAVPPARVLLFDFEMDPGQLEERYSCVTRGRRVHYNFSRRLTRVSLSPDFYIDDDEKYADVVMDEIHWLIEEKRSTVLIIDNITWLHSSFGDTKSGLRLMKQLNYLKSSKNLSILVLAHTPKRYRPAPLEISDLQGSKMIANFADTVFALGSSCINEDLRYLKQLKVRTGPKIYTTKNVATLRLKKMSGVAPAAPPLLRRKYLKNSPSVQEGSLDGGAVNVREIPQTLEPLGRSTSTRGSMSSQRLRSTPRSTIDHNRSTPFLGVAFVNLVDERTHIAADYTPTQLRRASRIKKAQTLHARGRSINEIANLLAVSSTTVKTYLNS